MNKELFSAQTRLLETILTKDYGGSEDLLLGELQFAFVAFMVGICGCFGVNLLLYYYLVTL